MVRITQGYRLDHPVDAAMFEDRRRLFRDLMRWVVPIVADRFEIDQFDTDEAIYLADVGEDGLHRGSMRLLPSTGAHLLADLHRHDALLDIAFGAVAEARGQPIERVVRQRAARLFRQRGIIPTMIDQIKSLLTPADEAKP